MRFTLTLIIWSIIIYSCNNAVKSKTELADIVGKKNLITKPPVIINKADSFFTKQATLKLASKPKNLPGKMIMVSGGQISASKETKIKGINFDLVLDGTDTTYLATTEESFKTPEGYSVGMQLSELPADMQKGLIKEPGWAYSYKLHSRWSLGFCEGNSCTDNYPTPYYKVT